MARGTRPNAVHSSTTKRCYINCVAIAWCVHEGMTVIQKFSKQLLAIAVASAISWQAKRVLQIQIPRECSAFFELSRSLVRIGFVDYVARVAVPLLEPVTVFPLGPAPAVA